MRAPPQPGFPLDDLTFILTHFLPHLNRDAVYRILKAEGLNRLPPAQRTRKPHGSFKDYEVGFIHVDVKHLPSCRIAITSRASATCTSPSTAPPATCISSSKTTRTTASAVAFLDEALGAFPFKVTHVLTDRSSCFTADAFEHACKRHGVQHRTTRPYTPKTNGMVSASTVACSGGAGHHALEPPGS